MTIRRAVERFVLLLVVLVAVSSIASQFLGTPILLSYVETGSMSPTLEPGDGFIAVPTAISGEIESGDVVVYRAEEVRGGGLTTHRVVGRTEGGYVTRGDGNPVTDQASGEPPVKESQIVATALQFNGHVVAVPGFGTAVLTVSETLSASQRHLAAALGTDAVLGARGIAYLFFGFSLLWYLVGAVRERGSRDRTRASIDQGRDVKRLLVGFSLLLVVGATVSMVGPAGQREIGFVSAEFDLPGVRVIERGTTESATYTVTGGSVPMVLFLRTDGKYLNAPAGPVYVAPGTTSETEIEVSAPRELGYYRQFLVEHRYLAVLPLPIISTLYELHPWAPIVVIDALLGGAFYAVSTALVGTGRLRTRSKRRDVPASTRLRRVVRNRYR